VLKVVHLYEQSRCNFISGWLAMTSPIGNNRHTFIMNEQYQNLVDVLSRRGTRLYAAPVAVASLAHVRSELVKSRCDFLIVRTGVASGFVVSDQVCLARMTGTAAEAMTIVGLVDLLAEAAEFECSHNWRRLLGSAEDASRFAVAARGSRQAVSGPHRGKRLL
jgi:hypothetical protein